MYDKAECKMDYVKDEKGEDMLLKEGKFQVMMEWEKPYMEACIDALQPFGDVLEIGFGCGYSASHIQTYFPKSHTIVEFHPLVLEKAERWASHYTNIHLVENTWQKALSTLGVFDAIFFDDYPLESEKQMSALKQSQESSSLWVKKGQELISSIEEKIPSLTKTQYQDNELITFLEMQYQADPLGLMKFFSELASKGQITSLQKQLLEKIMLSKGLIDEKQIISQKEERPSPFAFNRQGDRLFTFLEECLTGHMRKGSRFSCFLNDPTSKYQDKLWFDKIITNPFLDYEERRIPVEVPEHCDYYNAKEALVITITKK